MFTASVNISKSEHPLFTGKVWAKLYLGFALAQFLHLHPPELGPCFGLPGLHLPATPGLGLLSARGGAAPLADSELKQPVPGAWGLARLPCRQANRI